MLHVTMFLCNILQIRPQIQTRILAVLKSGTLLMAPSEGSRRFKVWRLKAGCYIVLRHSLNNSQSSNIPDQLLTRRP
jgi:hypothetical protein